MQDFMYIFTVISTGAHAKEPSQTKHNLNKKESESKRLFHSVHVSRYKFCWLKF